jgi:hypothetical protein
MSEEIEKALVLHRQLRNVLELHARDRKNVKALQRVRGLCTEANGLVPDVFCKDRLAQIQNLADALFGDRKQWTQEDTESVHSLRHRAYAALDQADRRLHLTLAVRRNEAIRSEGNTGKS